MTINYQDRTICITPRSLGLGGPASFQTRLIEALARKNVRVSFDPEDNSNSVILVIGGTRRIGQLSSAKRKGVRIVQRLNGMNWIHRKKNTGLRHYLRAEVNNYILSSIRKLSDAVIYQSEFSRDWWHRKYRDVGADESVIYNGVDLQQFSPSGGTTPPNDINRILLVEGHLGGGYEQGLFSGMQLVKLLNQRMPKPVELLVVGDVPAEIRVQAETISTNVVWRGIVKREEIPAIDRSAHLFYSSDINAACPNSVIEALACGLPVIGFDTGALPELVPPSAGRIAKYGGDVWNLDKPNIYALADGAQAVLSDIENFRLGAREFAEEHFDIDRITDQYLKVLFPE